MTGRVPIKGDAACGAGQLRCDETDLVVTAPVYPLELPAHDAVQGAFAVQIKSVRVGEGGGGWG